MTAERFDLIAPLLRQYKRRFHLLDVGGGICPYLSERISKEFDCVVTLIERDPLRSHDFGPRVMWLQRDFSPADLSILGECEHFDVVLALNFIHWQEEWQRAWTALATLGDHLLLQFPPAIEDADERVPGHGNFLYMHERATDMECLGWTAQFPRHQPRALFHGQGEGPRHLTRTTWGAEPITADTVIYSDLAVCHADMRSKGNIKDWVPALNLDNFLRLSGAWPERAEVAKMVRAVPLSERVHGDITVWNTLVDGQSAYLVDGYEGWGGGDRENLEKVARIVEGS